MADKVWIYHENRGFGPGAVARNLMLGLQKIGVEVVKQPAKADYLGCLQDPKSFIDFLPNTALMGPNLFVLPFEAPLLCNKFKSFVTPSKWVKDKYLSYPEMKNKHVHAWPVGIDTDLWAPTEDSVKTHDFFVYQKSTHYALSDQAQRELMNLGLKSAGILSYGNYHEQDLKNLCETCKFAALVTDTESQGIAYMQMLSSGLPCFVIDKKIWNYEGGVVTSAPASSVPYFDQRCGTTVPSRGLSGMSDNDMHELNLFVKNVGKKVYEPRDYILENHTLVHGAEEYMRLIKKASKL